MKGPDQQALAQKMLVSDHVLPEVKAIAIGQQLNIDFLKQMRLYFTVGHFLNI